MQYVSKHAQLREQLLQAFDKTCDILGHKFIAISLIHEDKQNSDKIVQE